MSKKPTVAALQNRIADLEAQIAALTGGAVTLATTEFGQTRYNVAGIKKDGLSFTPAAVDAIRLYVWPLMVAGVDKKEIIAALIAKGFNKGTVRARVKRIFDGTDEACHSEAIRARLGLDEIEDAAQVEDDEEEGDE